MRPDPSWAVGQPNIAPSEGLHEAVARTARAHPDAVAVVAQGVTVTYAELDRTANAWAARLVAAGVAPGDHVPILLPRSTELVVALLAVLKAGAVYALLDPTWPAARLQDVTAELAATILVTSPDIPGRPPLPVWSPPREPLSAPPGFRPATVSGSAPCCVFFTSGTTGRPKGVLVPHRATARLFQPNGFARFTTTTVMPLAAPVPWDAFSLELWSVLLNGGTSLVVEEPYLSAETLRRGVGSRRADTAWLTSSLFNMVVDEDLDAFGGLRQVMVGGERLSPSHVRRFLRRHPRITLLNGYGPVETTVFATTHRVTPADCDRVDGIPLGRPVPGTSVHVLDGSRPCAVGEPGEICVGGDGLALRYLGETALTDEKFVHVPIGGTTVRVYRTGDLGVWDQDGLLHFRGRADRQVKIRGHRVEPAEVERQVESLLPAVRSCRVLARRDEQGTARDLVAFCVPVEPGDQLAGAMPALRAALVAYQRPAQVVSVDAFPLTATGKLDERALLAKVGPTGTGRDDDGQPEQAQHTDPTAGLVAETFAAVLGRATVAPDVSFLEMGGTSLDAGRVSARLSTRLSRPVPVSRLYEYPTVTALAGWLRDTAPPSTQARTPAPATRMPEIPLTPMQLVYLTRHLLDPADRTSHCLLTWVVDGDVDRAALRSAIAAVHQRHEPLRAAYLPDPRPVACLVDIPPPPLEVLASQVSVDAALRTVRDELAGELEPTEADVWRVALVPVRSAEVSVIGCVVHHIAFDGWSESVLAGDLADAYNATRGGQALTTPPPPSLVDVHSERTRSASCTDLAAHHDYLVEELSGLPALRWPAGPAASQPGDPGVIEVPLSPSTVDTVDGVAAEAGVSRFTVLLAHFGGSLAEVTGQHDLAVGVPVAQRPSQDLERAIGCHINMVCVRLRGTALAGDMTAMREAGRAVRRAFVAQDVPYPEVLRLVDPPRTARPPLFQTLFALQDNPIPQLGLAGVPTTFVRQPYLDLPLELHAELWPDGAGGLRLTVYYRTDAVRRTHAEQLVKHFVDRLHTTASGAKP